MTTLVGRLPTAQAQAACEGLCRALFTRMVEATTIDWKRNQVWVQGQDNSRPGIGVLTRILAAEDVLPYFGMLGDLFKYVSILQSHDVPYNQQVTSPPPPHDCLCLVSGQETTPCPHQYWKISHHLNEIYEGWTAMVGRAILPSYPLDDSTQRTPLLQVDQKRRRPHSPFRPPLPTRGPDDYISFKHMRIVLSRVLEESKPHQELKPISASHNLPPTRIVNNEPSDPHAHQSAYLLPPSPHSIRSTRTTTSIVSDIRTFTAKSFDTFLAPNAPPRNPRQTALWSIPRQSVSPEPSKSGESSLFPHVPVQLPCDQSPRWDARRRALERLNDGVKFPVKDVARYTSTPPSPGQGGNWRWKEVEKDPWQNRRQHRQSSLSSGLDGLWRLSHKWKQWRKRPEEEEMQTGTQNPTDLEDPFKDDIRPPSPLIPVMNINKPLPPTPISIRASFTRRLSTIRTWRPRRTKAVAVISESPPTSASSSLVSLVWTDEDSTGYKNQQHAEDEDALGRLLAQDWHAVSLSGSRSRRPERRAKVTDSGVDLFPLRAMELS